MEASIAGAAIGATIQVLLQNLLSFTVEEIGLVVGFKKDLQKLKDSFLMVQDFISDAEAKQITSKPVKRWLKNLEDVAYDADNLLDEFNYQLLQQKAENLQMNTKKKVKSFFSGLNSVTSRSKMGHRIDDILKRLETINNEANNYGLQNVVMVASDVGLISLVDRETDAFQKDPVFLGRENDVSNLVKMINDCPMEKVFSIIPIVGMGGIGKTSLARVLLKDRRIDDLYKKKIWAYVSDHFDAMNLFKKILESTTAESVQVGTRQAILENLQMHRQGGRFLLVLDDTWNEDDYKWEGFINSLSGITSGNENCIIVTTISENVSSIVGTHPTYKLSSLSEDDCWSVIKERFFGGRDVPAEFETIGKRIAKRCQGLPLAANIIGGLLKFKKSKEEWQSILDDGLSKLGEHENKLKHILKLSYDHLPSPSLKKCFAYCSILPKGHRMNNKELVALWMSQGFLPSNRGDDDMESVGDSYFNYLSRSSLFQDVETYNLDRRYCYGDIRHCKMHDYVHDLACSISDSETNGVSDSASTSHEIPRVRHLVATSTGDRQNEISKEQARHLRTLFFEGDLSDDMFPEFKCLHTLSLTLKENVKEIPDSVGKLIHLRYLKISTINIKCLPDSVGKLYNLQTLQITGNEIMFSATVQFKLPKTMKNLINLRHLYCSSNVELELPPEIGKLTRLRTLQKFSIRNENGCGIGELGGLKNLKGELTIDHLERVKNNKEAKLANLSQKPNLFKLWFKWDYSSRAGVINDEEVLEGLQPHENIKELEIDGFRAIKFPSWTMKMKVIDGHGGITGWLNHLVRITLINCSRCEEIPMFGHLPHLKVLQLRDLPRVTCISASFYGFDNCRSISDEDGQETITLFPALEWLMLSGMPILTDWVEAQGTNDRGAVMVVFPCLKEWDIDDCPQLRSAPSHFSCLKSLLISRMDSALPLQNICSSGNTKTLERISIPNISGMQHLPYDFFVKFVNLSSVVTDVLHDCIQTLPSLRELRLLGSDDLNSLPEKLQHLTAITSLDIFDFGIESLPELLGNLSALEYVYLSGCKRLQHLPSKESMQRITKLDKVHIWNCPLLDDKSIEGTHTLSLEDYYN